MPPQTGENYDGRQTRNRGTYEMVAALLSSCKQPMNRNRIMHKANFSSSAIKYYIRIALKAGLVELLKDGNIVITEKGRKLLLQYQFMISLLESDVPSTEK